MGKRHTAGSAFLKALGEAGISYLFTGQPGDHSGMPELLVLAQDRNSAVLPRFFSCPDDVIALSAAQAYAMVAMEPQAVVIHDDADTLHLEAELSMAKRDRTPLLILAESEEPPSAPPAYLKHSMTIRAGQQVKYLVHRALQIARTEPRGPVRLVGSREVMNEEVLLPAVDPASFSPPAPTALSQQAVEDIVDALAGAEQPLIVTSRLGRDPLAVPVLVELAEMLAIPVLDVAACSVNFPADHPLYAGTDDNRLAIHLLLAAADLILAIDADLAQIPLASRCRSTAEFYYLGAYPLETHVRMIPPGARRHFSPANSRQALKQIVAHVRDSYPAGNGAVAHRRAEAGRAHARLLAEQEAREQPRVDTINAAYLTACLRRGLSDRNALILTELAAESHLVTDHLRANRPGSVLHRGVRPSAWVGGAAIGAKLAAPDQIVVFLVETGLSPSGVCMPQQGIAIRNATPVLMVIYNYGGWEPPAHSFPRALAETTTGTVFNFHQSFTPPVALADATHELGAAAYGTTVSDAAEVPRVLSAALAVVQSGHPAVVNARVVPSPSPRAARGAHNLRLTIAGPAG